MTALEEIKKALEGVTPGPWYVYSEKVADKAAAIAESAYQVEHTEPFVGEIFMLNAGGKCPALTGCGPCSEANAHYIAAVNPVAITELLSTLESLQREKEELRRDLSHEASHRQKLQNALAYWIPGVTEEIEISTNGRCGDDALLLVGSEGPLDDKCWGNEAIARAEAAEAEVKRLKAERLYIIGFNDGWEAAVGEPPEDASALSAQVQDAAGWQSMDTAPKDGTQFLAFEIGGYFNCWWHDNGYGEQYWMDDADSEPSPSHWMPLPAAPAKQEG